MNSISKYLTFVLPGSFFVVGSLFGQAAGNNNPGGVTAEYNGSVNTAGHYDPYTGNARREIDDIIVPGSIGAYPLKFTRILTTRGTAWLNNFGDGGGWSHSYDWSLWVRPPDEDNGAEDEGGLYTGPVRGLSYPGGGHFDTVAYTSPWRIEANGPHGADDHLIDCAAAGGCVLGATYELRRSDGGKVLFQPSTTANSYRVYRILDPYGQPTTLSYDASGRLWKVIEPGGRYLEFFYQNGVISMVKANDGRGNISETVTYQYAWAWQGDYFAEYLSKLTSVLYDDGAQANYTYVAANSYDAPGVNHGHLRAVVHSCDDPRYAGPMKYIEYDYVPWTEVTDVGRGQIKAEKNVLGQVVSRTNYPTAANPNLMTRTETRGDGATRTFNYPSGTASFTWTDFQNHLFTDAPITIVPGGWRITDPRNNTTSYDLEPVLGALKKVTYPGGATKEYTFTNPAAPYFHAGEKDENGHWTYFDRDSSNRVIKITYADTSTETFTYNTFGQVLTHKLRSGGTETFTYDARGLKTSSYPPPTESDLTPSVHPTLYYYYTTGPDTDRLYKVIDPRNNSTWFYYNQRGQVIRVRHHDATYTQSAYNLDGTLAWTADENHGGAATDPNQRTRYTYDQYKRVLTVTNPLGRTTTTSYALDPAWGTPQEKPLLHTTTNPKYVQAPSGKSTVYDYDDNLRKIDQVVALGTTDEAWTLFEYDAVGNLTKTTDPKFNATTFAYDNRNRQIRVTDALNQITSTTYDNVGNKTLVTLPDGKTLKYVYDSMNQVLTQTDERLVTKTMTYDLAGNLKTNNDGDATHVYSYTYDALNRRTIMTYPYGTTEKFSYDAAGNLATYTNRAGDIQTFQYDNRNRQTRFDWDDGVTSWQTTAYDGASRVTQIANMNATIKNLYFDDNTLKSQEEWSLNYADNFHRTVTYAYDVDGNRSNITYPSGKDFSYAYTERNQLWSIMDDLTGIYQVAYVYDKSGNVTTRYVGNNWIVTDSSQRDPVNQVKHIEHRFLGGNRSFDYTFNARGSRLTSKPDGGTAQNYIYDAAQQVTTAPRGDGFILSFVYDNNGNMTKINGGTAYASNNLNQYTTFNGSSVTYDGNGNLKTYNGWTYTFDAQNRLTRVQQGTATVAQYWYDGLNRQITRNVNGAITFHVWDGWNLIEERGTGNAIKSIYLYAGDQIIENVTTKQFFFQDSLGNTSHLSDEAGNLLERYTYSSFGLPTFYDPAPTATARTTSSKGTKHLFQGQLWASETGLNDYRNRVELPLMGVFLQPDPIGFKGDALNIYRFCGNNAVNRTDPDGLFDINLIPSWDPRKSHGDYKIISPNRITVGAHGTPTYMINSTWNGKYDALGQVPVNMRISPRDLATLIRALPKYTPQMLIRLEACQVGNVAKAAQDGKKAYAQHVANELQSNPVSANTGDVAVVTGTRSCDARGKEIIFHAEGSDESNNASAPRGSQTPVTSDKALGGGAVAGGRQVFDSFGSTTPTAAAWERSWGDGGLLSGWKR